MSKLQKSQYKITQENYYKEMNRRIDMILNNFFQLQINKT